VVVSLFFFARGRLLCGGAFFVSETSFRCEKKKKKKKKVR
jgi:hypothetical protein